MKYFIDTEFIEGFHKPLFDKKRHFIDLISIGIVADDGREYYAVSKEFDLEYIWNDKDTWVKENVIRPIHKELCRKCGMYGKTYHWHLFEPFTIKSMKNLLRWFGKTNKQIAEDVKDFVYKPFLDKNPVIFSDNWHPKDVEFYGYYADYDWVVFCSLFGRMIDLPKGFPMYCRDLKQMLDETLDKKQWYYGRDIWSNTGIIGQGPLQEKDRPATLDEKIKKVKELKGYPHQENEHNALDDAKWNKRLYDFIKQL